MHRSRPHRPKVGTRDQPTVHRTRHNPLVDDSRDLAGPWVALAAVRFLAELGMLAALAYTGWRLAAGRQAVGIVLAVILVGCAAAVWGRWVGPRSPVRLGDPARLLVEVGLFAVACVGLATVGAPAAAIGLAVGYGVSAPVGRRGH